MDKEKLVELLVLLQELIIEAVKNPTLENVGRVKIYIRCLYDLLCYESINKKSKSSAGNSTID